MSMVGRISEKVGPDPVSSAEEPSGNGDRQHHRAVTSRRKPRLRARNLEPFYWGVGSVVALGVVWEYVARAGIINRVFISSPSELWKTFLDMFFIKGDIWYHIAATGRIWSTGLLLGIVIGIAGGMVAGTSRRFRFAAEPYLIALYATPTVAFLPLLILWMGIGDAPKVALVCVGTMFPVLMNTQAGIQNVDKNLLETAAVFKATRWQSMWTISLPSSLPYIAAGIRLGIGRSLIMVFVAELTISNRGIGYIVANAGASFQSARMLVGVFTLTITGVVLTKLIMYIENTWLAYNER